MEKESIDDIARSIQRHRDLEIAIEASNPAIGRYKVEYGGVIQQMWLTNKENKGGVQRTEDINGHINGTTVGNRTTITEDGLPIYKNLRLGEQLIRSTWEPTVIQTPKGTIKLLVFNSSIYKPCSESLATDITVKSPEFNNPLLYRNLSEILRKIQKLNEEISTLEEEKEDASEEEIEGLLKEIEKKKEEKKKQFEKAQSFIRNHAELRYQPILDPWQEEVKRSKIFEGSLAINGGPGTGKTTSLIQRIKFLIDKDALSEYVPDLSSEIKDKLTKQKQSWIFFSPSELLSLYLKNSMEEEGLDAANAERVKVWDNHKNQLVQQYKLFNTETQRPFLLLRNGKLKSKALLPIEGIQLKVFVDQFNTFFLNHQKEKIQKLTNQNVSRFEWKNLGQSIVNYLLKQKDYTNTEQLIRLFNNLQDNFSEESQAISEEYKRLIGRAAGAQFIKLEKDENIFKQIKALLTTLAQDKKSVQEGEEFDEEEIENLDFEETTEKNLDFDAILLTKIKTLIRKSGLIKFDSNTRFTKNDQLLLEHLKGLDQVEELARIGELAYFKKHFEGILKGVLRNLFIEIPAIYKRFRKDALKGGTSYQHSETLSELVEKDNNKRLHPNEQSFLIYFINTLIKSSYKVSRRKSNEIKHPYFEAFKAYSKPVIGIDEATDFHLIDLLAMASLADPEISAVTYSGDLMQRLTREGLRDWNDLELFDNGFEAKDLVISYRQSNRLLNLAQSIYTESTGKTADYICYLEKDDTEPSPLILIDEDEELIIEWIGKRILEIYNAYGNYIPSIAIFLPSEEVLDRFANSLGEIDELADVGIQVKACKNGEVLGHKNTVRVFSIDNIKGLEFEAVFFHNLNALSDKADLDLTIRNLYVGLSRATFYLAITSQNELPAEFNYLTDLLTTDGSWQI